MARILQGSPNKWIAPMLFILAAQGFANTTAAQTNSRVASTQQACPDLSGHYRVADFGDALSDALKALDATMAGFTGSEVKLSGRPEEGLNVWLKSGSTGTFPTSPNLVLLPKSDFSCRDGWLVLSRAASASRKTEQGWYEGKSSVSIAPDQGGGLSIKTTFSGSQGTTIYSYDSARITVPKPFTRMTLTDSIRWPDISEPGPASTIDPPREPKDVLKVRQMLDSKVLGNVTLGGLKVHGDAVLVTLKAPREKDVTQLEDRLRAASISYEMKVPPIWSNSVYHMELLVKPTRAEKNQISRPSPSRVQQEMRKISHPMVDVTKVESVGNAYVATLNILGQVTIEHIIARLKANTDMFTEVVPLSESARVDVPNARIAQLRLQVR